AALALGLLISLPLALLARHRPGLRSALLGSVALPLAALTQPIGLVRAHLYAAFHSSRAGCGQAQGGQPISRAALTAVSGLSRRSQHAYERRARVRVSRNMAIGPRLTPSTREAVAWQQGAAVFIVTDKPGQQGRPGQRYLAWQLPNSYQGPHARLSRGRNRRRNRQLADLCIYGDAGNGQGKAVVVPGGRRYVGNGATAGRHSLEHPEVQVYWQAGRRRRGVWYLLRANLAESPSVVREARTTAPPDQNGIGDGRRA
ncbi:MAG TPA: hypothetical protein PLK31_04135, partial [Chloroflexota bacterium]|nr:hypothetical protein [Chloroflexota bacterium]